MKITKSELREIIREEIQALNEGVGVGKDYIKYLAVDKKLRELEAAQKELLNSWKSGKDETRKIQILKNGNPIKELPYTPQTLQKVFNKAMNIAGGLWNGVDKFTVKTL